jgi:hypothetical protein
MTMVGLTEARLGLRVSVEGLVVVLLSRRS